MSSLPSGRAAHSRVSRSESAHSNRLSTTNEKENEKSDDRAYPGSLHRSQHAYPVPGQFRTLPDIQDVKTPGAYVLPRESFTDSSTERSPTRDSVSTMSDQANELFPTAANGVASAPPTRAPAPVPNGKAVSPAPEVPQSVSSTDPKVAAQQASDMRNIVRRKLTGYVGFANLPNQWHRKSVRKGFNFNVMVVGEFNIVSGIDARLTDYQVSLVLVNRHSSTPSSTPPSTHPGSARDPASTSSQRPCPSNPLVPILRRTAFVCV